MIGLLLPVKSFARSKERLATWLTPPERELLARTMFEDVWRTLGNVHGFDHLLVASADPYVISRCHQDGVACLVETEQRSHSNSVQAATRWAMSQGVSTLISVPIDTPGVIPDEMALLIEEAQRQAVVIVPSADGTGTNALARTPADAIEPHFGPGSCRVHAQEAKSKGLPYSIFPVPGFAADIDTLDDAEQFLSRGRSCQTERLLREFLATRQRAGVCA